MNFLIRKSRIGVLVSCCLSVGIHGHSQNYTYDVGSGMGITVNNSSRIFQLHTSLNLSRLYSMTKSERENNGIAAHFDSNTFGPDGMIEVRVYDYDDQTAQRGNLIFGCRSAASGFHSESWDLQFNYEHWESWKEHYVSSTDIKFLSQHEKVGALCETPPVSFWLHPQVYLDIGIMAQGLDFIVDGTIAIAALGIMAPPLTLIALPVGIVGVSLVFADLYRIHSEVSKEQEFFEAKLNSWKSKLQDENGDWCNVITFQPKVLVELTIKNAYFDNVVIPGIGTLYGFQFLPNTTIHSQARSLNMEVISANETRNLSVNNTLIAPIPPGITGYPLPTKLVVPKSSGYVGWVDVEVPIEGRILAIATRERIDELDGEPDLQNSVYRANMIGPIMYSQSAGNQNEIYIYHLYSISATPGTRIYFEVNEFGPFLAGYDFELFNPITPPLALAIDALDNPNKFPNYTMVAAYRGYSRHAPENSLQAIEDCIDFGVDMVSVDVRKTIDGELMVASDLHLGRLTTEPVHLESKRDANGRILISDLTLCEIRPDMCDDNTNEPVRLKHPDGTPAEPMPTFKQVLYQCKGRIIVDAGTSEGFYYEVFRDAREAGTTQQVVVKGQFESPEDLFDETKVHNADQIDWRSLRFIPVYSSDFDIDFEQSISDFISYANRDVTDPKKINMPGVELIYRNDSDPLLQYRTAVRQNNDRVFQFAKYPESCEGVFNSKEFNFIDTDPRADFRNDYGWLLAPFRRPDLLTSDRLEILMHILEILGMRNITEVNSD